MTALKWITNKAKSIRKGHKTMTWKAAIKKAGVEYRATHKAKPIKKTVKKKTVRRKVVKSITGNYASKRKAVPRAKHTDTKSHNVNVRVISGISGLDNEQKRQLNYLYDQLRKSKGQLEILRIKVKNKEKLIPFHKLLLKRYPKYISHTRRQIVSLEKQMK